jgi:hypothetical protein
MTNLKTNIFSKGEIMNLIALPWVVASLLAAASSIFGQEQNQEPSCVPSPPVCKRAKCCVLRMPQESGMCGFNAPAEINVGCEGDIDLFGSASFLYWQPSQDNMQIGLTNKNGATYLGPPNPAPPEVPVIGDFIEMDFSYQPGFKVGMGMNLQRDDWDGYAEYTRVHGTSSASSNGPVKGSNASGPVPAIFSTFGRPFFQGNLGLGGQVYNTVSAKYKNNLDFLDAEMGRTYYVGKSLIFRPAWGARAAWILQNIHVQYKNIQTAGTTDASSFINAVPSVFDVFQNSHSWAIGPRMGLMMDWMLGYGLRFFGSGYGDLLYTKYKVRDKSVVLPLITVFNSLVGVPVSITTRGRPIGLRTHLDLEMGLGWGTYFDHNKWHIDFSASYGWQVFFDQNMFRGYASLQVAENTLPNGNLYVQGLMVTARVDF